jgi:hypothetical protein
MQYTQSMSDAAPIPQSPGLQDPDDAPDPAVLRAERRLRILDELAEIGMALARALLPGAAEEPAGDEAAADEAANPKSRAKPVDPTDAFARISRAVRLTLALEAKTDEALRDLKAGVVREREDARVKAAERDRVASIKRSEEYVDLVPALVARAVDAEIEDPKARETLYEALHERLDEDEAYDGFVERPLRETVERLCHDLGLNPDWSRWDGEGWIVEGPPARERDSIFNQPSPHPLLRDGPWNAKPAVPPPMPTPATPPGMRHPGPFP